MTFTPHADGRRKANALPKEGSGAQLLELLNLSPHRAAEILGRTRQALYPALGPNGSVGHFRPQDLVRLYIWAARGSQDVQRSAFLEFIDRALEETDAAKVRSLLMPSLGREFTSLILVIPDYAGLRSRSMLSRDAVFDVIRCNPDCDVAACFSTEDEAKLFAADLSREEISTKAIEFRAGKDSKASNRIASIPPLLVLDPHDRTDVFSISRGKFKKSEYDGGARLAMLLKEDTIQVDASDPQKILLGTAK